ncbi:type II toxin-antitoxin system RatA family toxin [Alphaproteobacteria bacterium]|nr:type II toxin-antitoxin system RatA family toxin [Alphaproteobacteria bacterium]
MPSHSEKKILNYSQKQLFDLVSDIDSYEEFLPWCLASRVTEKEKNIIKGDLVIGFKMFREKFSSEVTLVNYNQIDVNFIKGPFKYLKNRWIFVPHEEQEKTTIDFFIDFEFKSKILEKIIGNVFNSAVKKMISAFEKRAEEVYGIKNKLLDVSTNLD